MTDGHKKGLQTLAQFRSNRITGLSFHGSSHCHKNGRKIRHQMLYKYHWREDHLLDHPNGTNTRYLAYELNGRDKKRIFLEFFGFLSCLIFKFGCLIFKFGAVWHESTRSRLFTNNGEEIWMIHSFSGSQSSLVIVSK